MPIQREATPPGWWELFCEPSAGIGGVVACGHVLGSNVVMSTLCGCCFCFHIGRAARALDAMRCEDVGD